MNSNNLQKTEVAYVNVSESQLGQRLDNFLFKYFNDLPKTRVYRIIRKGEVRINRKRCKPDYKLQLGDQIRIPPVQQKIPEKSASRLPNGLLQQIENSILYENTDLLIIDKPGGLAVHSGSGIKFGVIDVMRHIRTDIDIELVHRLDRDTSGCLLLAKNRKALLILQNSLTGNRLKKKYYAVVKGCWSGSAHKIEHRLKKYNLSNGERRVAVDNTGKSALSLVQVVQTNKEYSLVEVEIVTGRTHQIRVHCQAEGHEIAGDDKYGDKSFNRYMRQQSIKRLMLHAFSLELPASEISPQVIITADMPREFQQLVN